MDKQAYFQITERCNQACVFCLRPAEDAKDVELKELKRSIDEMSKEGVNRVYITGGEPMLHKDLFKIISYLKKVKISQIDLQTNGVALANKKLTSDLKKAGINTIYFSLNDHTEKLSVKTRGVKGCFKKTLAGIRNCLNQELKVYINHVVYQDNYKKLPQFIDFLKNNFPTISYLNLSLVSPQGRALSNEWTIPKYSEIKPYLVRSINKCKKWGIHFNVSAKVPLCIIKGYEEFAISTIFMIDELVILNRYINHDKGDISNNNDLLFKDIGKDGPNKAPQCKKCTVNKICSGFYEGYADIWGYGDFVPYKENVENILKKFTNYKNKKTVLKKKK